MRRASLQRQTKETRIEVELDLEAGAASSIAVPDGFFGHMLEALAVHSGLGLRLSAQGDTAVDLHHTVEDTGIVLGEALAAALGDRRGVVRFAHAYAPLDEALARAVIDLSGRGFFVFSVPPELEQVWVTREFPLTLVADFFQAFADRARLTLHLNVVWIAVVATDGSVENKHLVSEIFLRHNVWRSRANNCQINTRWNASNNKRCAVGSGNVVICVAIKAAEIAQSAFEVLRRFILFALVADWATTFVITHTPP